MKYIKNLDKYLIYVLVFLYPLFFTPLFVNAIETSKLFLLSFLVIVIGIIKIVKAVVNTGFKIKISKFDLFIVGFTAIYTISAIFISPSKIDAFFSPGPAGFIIFGTILYFYINQFNKDDKRGLNLALIASGLIFAIIHLLLFTKIINLNYSLFGNNITNFSFLVITLIISAFETMQSNKRIEQILTGIASFVIFIAVFTSFYLLLQKTTAPILPPLKTSWAISIDSLKENTLLGVGPANFLYGYNKYRPLTVNQSAIWDTKFVVASNTLLTIFTESGLIAIILFITLFVLSLKDSKNINSPKLSLLFVFVICIFYPLLAAFLPIIFILFSLNNESSESSGSFTSKLALSVILLPSILTMALGIFAGYKVFYPEYVFNTAMQSISKNEVINAYKAISKAISLNQYVDRYHLVAAEININVARNISQKENMSDEDKKTLSEMIQQSINEGKAAISINPKKASSWEKLGDIYVTISPFAEESNKFAIQSYNQAISLDPINPAIRVKLGGVYLNQKKYEEAIKIFELAVLAKQDYANSHYNLALAFRENKQLDKAKEQMKIVLQLVSEDSDNYRLAKSELDKMETPTE